MGKVKTRGIVIRSEYKIGDDLESSIYKKAHELGATEAVVNSFDYNKSAEVDFFKDKNGGMVGFAYSVRVD